MSVRRARGGEYFGSLTWRLEKKAAPRHARGHMIMHQQIARGSVLHACAGDVASGEDSSAAGIVSIGARAQKSRPVQLWAGNTGRALVCVHRVARNWREDGRDESLAVRRPGAERRQLPRPSPFFYAAGTARELTTRSPPSQVETLDSLSDTED